MNSKQISTLPTIFEDPEKAAFEHKLISAYGKKLLINDFTRRFLEVQLQLSEISKELQNHIIDFVFS